jgi:hypothetical protein
MLSKCANSPRCLSFSKLVQENRISSGYTERNQDGRARIAPSGNGRDPHDGWIDGSCSQPCIRSLRELKEGGVFFGFSRQNFPSAPKRWASKACSGFQRLRPSNERQARVAKLLKRRPGWLRRGRQTWHQPQPAARRAARAGCGAACTACVEFRNENSVLTHAPMKREKMDFEESAKKM